MLWSRNISTIPVIAMILSFISITIQLISCFVSNQILNESQYIVLTFSIKSKEVGRKTGKLQYTIQPIISKIASILEIDPLSITVNKPTLVTNGLKITAKIRFNFEDIDLEKKEYLKKVNAAKRSGDFADEIQSAWRLKDAPSIEGISVETDMQSTLHSQTKQSLISSRDTRGKSEGNNNDTLTTPGNTEMIALEDNYSASPSEDGDQNAAAAAPANNDIPKKDNNNNNNEKNGAKPALPEDGNHTYN